MVETALASDSSDFLLFFEERRESAPLGDSERLANTHIFREVSN